MDQTQCGWIGRLWIGGGAQTGGGARTRSLDGDLCWRVLLYGAWSSLSLECSCEKLERVCERCKWFEGKIKAEIILIQNRVILQLTQKLIFV